MNKSRLKITSHTHYYIFALLISLSIVMAGQISDRIGVSNNDFAKADTCGNSVVETSETCDDGNTSNGDGCSSACQISITGWTTKQAITIDHTKVGETLSNFPILLKDNNFTSDIYSNAETDGKDLFFTSDEEGTTPLPFEVVNWNTGGQTSEVWVKIPSISSSADTTFYVWYNNSSAIMPSVTAANGKRNVWDSNYKGVWHLNETVTDEGTTGTHTDSTVNNNTGTQTGNDDIAGQIGTAQVFDGANDYVNVADSASLDITGSIAVSMWIKADTDIANYEALMAKRVWGTGTTNYEVFLNLGTRALSWYDGTIRAGSFIPSAGQWYNISAVSDDSTLKFYVNGSLSNQVTGTTAAANAGNLYLGGFYSSEWEAFHGIIDEIKISSSERSAGWIMTEYNNQNNPGTFVIRCGDGDIDTGETCDDNNTNNGDGCNSTCHISLDGYNFKHQITIDHTKVGEDLTSFQVLLKDGNFDNDVYSKAETDGRDMLFTSDEAGTTFLPFEVVSWNSVGQTSEVWVKIPSLSASTNTTLWVWYDNPSAIMPDASANDGKYNVWDSNYKAVYHLNETVTDEGTTAAHYDSTLNGINGTQNGNDDTTGRIGNAQVFDGNDCIHLPTDFVSTTSSFSVEGMFKTSSSIVNEMIWSIEGYFALYINKDSVGKLLPLFDGSSSGDPGFGSNYNDDNWHHFVSMNNGATTSLYVDGSFVNSRSESLVSPTVDSRASAIGSQIDCVNNLYSGSIDEIRFANSTRTAGWISTEYNNQNDPSTFASKSTPKVSTPAPTATNYPTSYGSTNFSAISDFTSIPNMKLANANGSMQWLGNTVNAENQNFDTYVKVGSGFVSMDPANVHDTLTNNSGTVSGFNTKVQISVAGCDTYTVYYANEFYDNLTDIKTNGQVCNASTTPACTNIRCVNRVLSFNVPHFDSYGGEGAGPSIETSTGVLNAAPMITVTPSDGGSDSSAPTNSGADITFTATASDLNSIQDYPTEYYLAICKTDAITAGNNTSPNCDGGAWVISVEADSDAQASVNYTTQTEDSGSQAWYAFVCDKVAGTAACFPANTKGDQGFATGNITFSNVPEDGATVTIDGTTYEFDTANNGIIGGRTEVDTSAAESAQDVTSALDAVDTGGTIGSRIVSVSNVAYIYATAEGIGGTSIGLAESNDTSNYITLSGANLVGVSDVNASPFFVNQIPTFGTMTITDNTDGAIEPGDTIKFKLPEAQIDDDGTINMYICPSETDHFDYTDNQCEESDNDPLIVICSDTAVNPDTEDAVCTGGADLISVPTAHGSYNFKVYVEDDINTPATGTNAQSYTVTDVAPTLVSYTAIDAPDIAAGGYDTINFSAVISDGNGDNDITAVDGVLFEDTAVNNNCTADENDCYIDTVCDLSNISTPGTGKTATGIDAELTASCSAVIWFNTSASANWEVHVNPTDGLGKATGLADSNVNLEVTELAGLDIVQSSIAYGNIEIGAISARQETRMSNMGNLAFDIMVEGNEMACKTSETPVCTGYSIALGQQKWHHTDTDFNWNSAPTAPGPYTLVDTASGTDDETGCLNRDIAVRNTHDSDATDESIWWELKIPEAQRIGTYTGENTFISTAPTTCSAGQSY